MLNNFFDDLRGYREGLLAQGFWALQIYRFGHFRYSFTNKAIRIIRGIVIHGLSVIGDDCMIRQGVTIGNRHVDKPLEAPILGSRVNVGAGAKILGKIVIGDDVDIGANAVVIKDVPTNHIAVGVPAVNKPRPYGG
ncbi:MAG: serine acetyltransferase [Methyloglobulus sp.]|nr:serine acetyltransferase [Methyloglobulus sp.]